MRCNVVGWLLGYTAAAYWLDVVARPAQIAQRARRLAAALGKPVLNVGAGTPGSSLRVALFGPATWGDINLDIAAPPGQPAPSRVVYGDVHALSYPDKYFGVAVASHVLEHVRDPVRALRELHRVADYVFVITPKWWAPHTWLYADHRWYRTEDGRWLTLWR